VSAGTLLARCPAKINLGLRVLGRRPDGYHELDTVFQAVDLWDEIEGRLSVDISLDCREPGVPVDGTNLVLRAAAGLRTRFGTSAGAALRLRKSIPLQAGLGGGSSDAAGALLLCSRLWGLDPPVHVLEDLARELGADVPFFLHGGTARGTGRGDRIERLPDAPSFPVLLGRPPFGISTAEVFRRLPSKLTLPAGSVSVAVPLAHKWPKQNDFAALVNDLEEVVFDGWPPLRIFRDALVEAGARGARLSGSGSTVYGIFSGEDESASAARRLGLVFPGWRLIPTRAVRGGVRLLEAAR
jgi:4-diphosphocytidyl-2-C-methyl-D-erythritol kinase